MIKAIIFDADGPLYYRASDIGKRIEELLEEYGYRGNIETFYKRYDQEKFKAYVGEEAPAEMFRKILISLHITISVERAEKFSAAFDRIHQQVAATPDAVATLALLKSKGYLTCVLTDSFYPAKAKWPWFEQLGLASYLDDIVSSIDIKKDKHTSDAYQACVNALGVPRAEAIFVGHQQYEMDGAKAAKIISVAILPIATPNIQADHLITSLSELPDLLVKLNREQA